MIKPLSRLFIVAAAASCSDAGGDTDPINTAESAGSVVQCSSDTSCDDFNACTLDYSSSDACETDCEHVAITYCQHGDGCCAAGCKRADDDDCEPACGNGYVDKGETCDGNCPSCDDGNACTIDYRYGSYATCDKRCEHEAVSGCRDDDGCCPGGCNVATDNDCSPACGNGVVDAGETCDQACPIYCSDGNPCTTDVMTGSPETCNVQCTFFAVTTCADNDQCCGVGCTALNDIECSPSCGNGTIEPPELCDQNCPTSCDDQDACTLDQSFGSPDTCNVFCVNQPLLGCGGLDGCCQPGCAGQDPDCPFVDLTINKVDLVDPVPAGGQITYTLEIANNGNGDAHQVMVIDPLPPGTTFVSLSAPPGWGAVTPAPGLGGEVVVGIGTFAPGMAIITLVVDVVPNILQGGVIHNEATIQTADPEIELANNHDSESTTIAGIIAADVGVTKVEAISPVAPGGVLTYFIVVTNAGNAPAANVTWTDVLPPHTTFHELTLPAGWSHATPPQGDPGTVSLSTPSLEPAAVAAFTLKVRVDLDAPIGELIENTVTVTTTSFDLDPGNQVATEQTPVELEP